MKYTILNLIVLASFINSAAGQNVNIPDANFKAYLVGNAAINTNSDTEIQVSEANAYSLPLNIQSLNIADLKGIEEFVSITKLICYNNSISGALDLTQNVALTEVNCNQNLITSLDLSQNTALTILYCNDNILTNLDLTNNINLQELTCHFNNLTSLDLTQNIQLTKLFCSANDLTSLDLSNNPGLTQLGCNSNNLSVLDMRNLSTTLLTYFDASSNGFSLTCIDADDIAAATATWTGIDAGVSFSLNCQIDLVNAITVQGQAGISTISTPDGTLQMTANVLPTYADDDSYTWSVTNGTGSATIDSNGLLTALTDGNVTVVATANDGSGTTGSVLILISNQTVGIQNEVENIQVAIYPNPFKSDLTVACNDHIETIIIHNTSGQIVKYLSTPNNSIDLSDLPAGVYNIQIQTEVETFNKMIIKE